MSKVKTTCYGKTREWESREKAKEHFFECMLNSEGSENQRYVKIYIELCLGHMECTDEEE